MVKPSRMRKGLKPWQKTRRTHYNRTSGWNNKYGKPGMRLIRHMPVAKQDPLGRRLTMKMQYVQTVSLTSQATTGYPGVYSFRTNSIYDPDFTGGGHQPQLHDQMSVMYSRYIVHGMSYRVVFNTPGSYNWRVGALATNDTTYNPSVHTFDETVEKRAGLRWAFCTKQAGSKTLKGYISNSKVVGLPHAVYEAETDKFGAVMGANPSTSMFLTLIANTTGNDESISIYATVELVYYVSCYDQKIVAQS